MATEQPPRLRRRRQASTLLIWLAVVLVAVPLLLLSLGGGTLWLLADRTATLPWLLAQVPGLQVQGLRGTLRSGSVEIDQLDWRAGPDGPTLQMKQIVLSGWRVSLSRLVAIATGSPPPVAKLHVDKLSAESLVYRSSTRGTKPTLPSTLRSPLALQVDEMRLARLQINDLPEAHALSGALELAADSGGEHRLNKLQMQLEQATLNGSARLASAAPFGLQVDLAAESNAELPWSAKLSAKGPLDKLQVQADLQGQPQVARSSTAAAAAASLHAQATVLPFADWPLGDLSLSTQALNLGALWPGLPHTLLSGQALVHTHGLNSPAQVSADIANALPGGYDEGRVPLRKLSLRMAVDPRHRDTLLFEHFTLTLGDAAAPAGQASGSGRWQGEHLDLTLQLTDLLPARLDRRAAALRVTGPVKLAVDGLPAPDGRVAPARGFKPHFSLQSQLTGQTLDGKGAPVALTLNGDFSADRLRVAQAEAASGEARARLTLDAQRDGHGWKLNGQGDWRRFDPLPWWRGPADSAWRKGPHRLDGDFSLALGWHPVTAAAPGPPGPLGASRPIWERWLQALDGDAKLSLVNSLIGGMPLDATLRLRSQASAMQLDARLSLGANSASLSGQRARLAADDRWRVEVDAPAVGALAPLLRLAAQAAPGLDEPLLPAEVAQRWPDAGSVRGKVELQGRWPALRSSGQLQTSGLHSTVGTLSQAKLDWAADIADPSTAADHPLRVELDADGVRYGNQRLGHLNATVRGSFGQHTLRFVVDSPAKPPAWTDTWLGPAGTGTRLEGTANGRWARSGATPDSDSVWRVQAVDVKAGARLASGSTRPWLSASGLSGDLTLDAQGLPRAMALAPGRVQMLTTGLRWSQASWQAASASLPQGSVVLAADLETFAVAPILAQWQPELGWKGDLSLSGKIDIRHQAKLDADIVLERGGGDLTLTDELGNVQPLGIAELRLALSAHDGLWQFAQGLAGTYTGEMAGAQVLRTAPELLWPARDATLQGVLQANVANLGAWGTWVPPGWRLSGALQATGNIGGTLAAPELRGQMSGSKLGVRNLLQGVSLSEGTLAIDFNGDSAVLRELRFKGGDGELKLTGGASLGATPVAKLQLEAEHFRLLGRIDRRIIASGTAKVQLDAQNLVVDGQIKLDEGLIDFSQADAPTLDSDVVVKRAGEPVKAPVTAAERSANLPTPLRQARVNVAVNLGEKLRLRGRGIDTGLRGELTLSSPGGRLALNGQVRADGGTYAAYGQKLEIDRGELTFSGALENPRLDVLAIRPNLDVKVGVAVTGTAQSPRVRLTSEPELAEMDKLSWLVLGRASDGLGRSDTALLQRAAVALLAGDGKAPTDAIFNALGIDDFSVRQSDGDTRDTIVSLGKQLSRRWYVGYERGVNATSGTWQLIYRIAQRFTLRAQSGNENAVDLIWQWRW